MASYAAVTEMFGCEEKEAAQHQAVRSHCVVLCNQAFDAFYHPYLADVILMPV